MKHTVLGQQELIESNGVMADRRMRLNGYYQNRYYPNHLRLATVSDPKTGEAIYFITNNFSLDVATIAKLYKSRWQIETFLKWIKQNLKIKSLLCTSKYTVMTQILSTMIYYLLLSSIKFQTKCKLSRHELTRIIG